MPLPPFQPPALNARDIISRAGAPLPLTEPAAQHPGSEAGEEAAGGGAARLANPPERPAVPSSPKRQAPLRRAG